MLLWIIEGLCYARPQQQIISIEMAALSLPSKLVAEQGRVCQQAAKSCLQPSGRSGPQV